MRRLVALLTLALSAAISLPAQGSPAAAVARSLQGAMVHGGAICRAASAEGTTITALVDLPSAALTDGDVTLIAEDLAELGPMRSGEVTALRLMARTPGAGDFVPIESLISHEFSADNAWDDLTAFGEPPATSPPDYGARPITRSNVTGQGPLGTAAQPSGALSGRTVFFSAGHGWVWNGSTWVLQRPQLLDMNEDHGNLDQINFFAQYVFNAGATVVPMRPLGHQPNEVIVDNPQAIFAGPWSDSTSPRHFGTGTPAYRFAEANLVQNATATYTPDIPEAGFYPVYTWVLASSNRVPDQLYQINHTGGTALVRINHRRVGNGWVWLGTYHFEAGSNPSTGSVVISNQSGASGGVVIADAIRFGNGVGDSSDGGRTPSGYLRETECSRQWVQRGLGEGGDTAVYDTPSSDSSDNVGTPPRMAAQMRRDDGQGYSGDVYLGFHSNAAGCSGGPPCSARGAVGLITTSSTPTNNSDYATLVAREVRDDCQAEDGPGRWPCEWASRTLTFTSAYGEFSGSNLNGEMCGTIIEVAFHDNTEDSTLLREPRVRNVIGRACYQAVVRYFNQFDGLPLAFLPEPPVRVRAVVSGPDAVTLSWLPGPAGGAGGDAATGFTVYRSANGLGFGHPVTTTSTSATITGLAPGQTHYFRVASTNDGGESLPTEVLAVNIPPSGSPEILIVNGYDRLDRFNNVRETRPPLAVDRLHLRQNNSCDYVIEHAAAIAAAGRGFDSCTNEAFAAGDVDLARYRLIVWCAGEQGVDDDTLPAAAQALLASHLGAGKSLFVSGADIGFDLDRPSGPSPGDRAFFNDQLRADFAGDDAHSHQATGAAGSIFQGLTMNFAPDADIYDADAPDQINPLGGAVLCATYTGGGSGGAAIQFEGDDRVVYLAFPFETIGSAAVREQVMAAALDFLLPEDLPIELQGIVVR